MGSATSIDRRGEHKREKAAGIGRIGGRVSALTAALVTAIALTTLAIVAAFLVRGSIEESAETAFRESSDQVAAAVESEVAGYLEELSDVGSYVAHSGGTPDSETFEAFVRGTGIFDRLDPVVGVLVLHRIPAEDFHLVTEDPSALGLPELTLVSLGEVPDGEPHYLLTYYVADGIDLDFPIGTDITPFTSVSSTMSQAEETGSAVAGSFQDDPLLIELADLTVFDAVEEILDLDFFIGLPVIPQGGSAEASPLAWVAAPVSDFGSVLDDAATGQPQDIGIELQVDLSSIKGDDLTPVTRVADREGSAGALDAARYSDETTFETAGMPWRLTTWGSVAESGALAVFLVILLGGMATALLAGLLVWVRLRGRQRERAYFDALQDREQMQSDILDSVAAAMVLLDRGGRIVATNPAWRELRAAQGGAVEPGDGEQNDIGRTYLDVIREVAEVDSWLDETLASVVEGGSRAIEQDVAFDVRVGRRWHALRITPLHGSRGGALIVHTDVTERKESEAELAVRANHDPLTGLLNRAAIEREVDVAVARAADRGQEVGLLFIDLDGFKAVNDTLGHEAGDEVLRAVGRRLTGAVRATDRVARLGGDEFVVLIGALQGVDEAESTARRVLDGLGPPVDVADGLSVLASIGIAVVGPGTDPLAGSLIGLADRAMYVAKQAGGHTYAVAGRS